MPRACYERVLVNIARGAIDRDKREFDNYGTTTIRRRELARTWIDKDPETNTPKNIYQVLALYGCGLGIDSAEDNVMDDTILIIYLGERWQEVGEGTDLENYFRIPMDSISAWTPSKVDGLRELPNQ